MSGSLKDKTVSGTIWSFVDFFSLYGIGFLIGIVLARILDVSVYGVIGIVGIFIEVFATITDGGFSAALIRKSNVKNIDYSTAFVFNFCVSIFLYLLLFVTAPYIAVFFEDVILVKLLRVMGITIVIASFSFVNRTILVKDIDFKTRTKISITTSVISGFVGISMALTGYGVWSLVFMQITKHFSDVILYNYFKPWHFSIKFSRRSFKDLFNFGYKLLLSGLLNSIWSKLYYVVIGKFYSSVDLGEFTRAEQYNNLFSQSLTSVVQRVSFPVLSTIKDDQQRLRMGYRKMIKTTMLVSFAVMLGLAAIAKPLIILLIGEKWLPSVYYLQILCFAGMLYPFHSINLNVLSVKGRSDLYLKLEVIKKAIAVIPIVLGIYFGIPWMLWLSVLVSFACIFINTHFSAPLINYSTKEQISDLIPFFIISLFVSGIVWSISLLNLPHILSLIIQIPLGVILTIAIYEKYKCEEYEELKAIFFKILNGLMVWKKR